MKLSVNEAKLTGLRARNCGTIQQVLISKFVVHTRKVIGAFEKRAPGPPVLTDDCRPKTHQQQPIRDLITD